MSPQKNRKRRERRKRAKQNKNKEAPESNASMQLENSPQNAEALNVLGKNLGHDKLKTNLDDFTIFTERLQKDFYCLGGGFIKLDKISTTKNRKRKERRKRAKMYKNKEATGGNTNIQLEKSHQNDDINLLSDNLAHVHLTKNLEEITVNADRLEDEFYILGEGSFGLVTLGIFHHASGRKQKVALKAPSKKKFNKVFLDEAEVMLNFDHKNVIKVLAFQKSPMKIAIEYMDKGDLSDAVERIRFTDSDFIDILHQIATGMEYISRKQYLHLDLACRNVFMNSQKVVKIGDFGLCRYVGDTGGIFHLKDNFYNFLSAPEGRFYGTFTSKSDVWSMGLLIWDLYATVSGDFRIFKKFFLEQISIFPSFRLPKPPKCPIIIYQYIKHLMAEDPDSRPSFTSVKEKLSSLL